MSAHRRFETRIGNLWFMVISRAPYQTGSLILNKVHTNVWLISRPSSNCITNSQSDIEWIKSNRGNVISYTSCQESTGIFSMWFKRGMDSETASRRDEGSYRPYHILWLWPLMNDCILQVPISPFGDWIKGLFNITPRSTLAPRLPSLSWISRRFAPETFDDLMLLAREFGYKSLIASLAL
jgi:hypothetical protein